MVRIAYIINSLEGGGAAFPIPSLLSLMQQYGAEVKIFALLKKDGKALPPIQKANIPVCIREGNLKDHFSAFKWLNQEISQYKPSILWTSLTRATLLGQLVGLKQHIPVISWQHAAYLKPWNLRLLKATKNLSQIWLGDSQRITQLTKERLNIPDHKLITWPIFQATPNTNVTQPWQRNTPIKIVSMGRLHPVKGYDVFIRAIHLLNKDVSTLPPFTVSIYGQGNEYANLNALIQQYKLQNIIQLCGFTESISQTLVQHHLYIQPSQSEGFCIAAHEAMQVGLPVIASAVGELPFSIENNINGITVPPNNPQILAQAIHELLSNPENLYQMGTAARQKILNNFSREYFESVGRQVFNKIKILSTSQKM